MLLAYLTKGEETPDFDEAMEIAKEYMHWDINDICWVSGEVLPKLDRLTEQEHPAEQEHEEVKSGFR